MDALLKVSYSGCVGGRSIVLTLWPKLKDTKTTKGGPSCPTLLHYLARLLLRTDASLTTFIEELPNVEAAARRMHIPSSSFA